LLSGGSCLVSLLGQKGSGFKSNSGLFSELVSSSLEVSCLFLSHGSFFVNNFNGHSSHFHVCVAFFSKFLLLSSCGFLVSEALLVSKASLLFLLKASLLFLLDAVGLLTWVNAVLLISACGSWRQHTYHMGSMPF
jgi:hypothetical protein